MCHEISIPWKWDIWNIILGLAYPCFSDEAGQKWGKYFDWSYN